jgi:cell division protein FtsB
MSDSGIIIPLRERIKDLEIINLAHQKKNGQLRQEIQDKDKEIKDLKQQTIQLGLDKFELIKNGEV